MQEYDWENFKPLGVRTPEQDLVALADLVTRVGLDHGIVVEIGSWVGRTALCMHEALRANSPAEAWFGTIYCIDTFKGTPSDVTGELASGHSNGFVFKTFCENCERFLLDTIVPLVGTSRQWAQVWPYFIAEPDLIFIDGNHNYNFVCDDIRLWMPKVREGGIICGHDFGVYRDVSRAVHDTIGPVNLAGYSLWWREVGSRSRTRSCSSEQPNESNSQSLCKSVAAQ